MKTISELLKELDKAWNCNPDERYRGENPVCDKIQETIEEMFREMQDDEIKSILDGLQEGQKEQLEYVIENLVDERQFLQSYLE